MNDPKKVAVIIPFYKEHLTDFEKIALEQCFSVLADYQIIAIKPEHLALKNEQLKHPFSKVVSFSNNYFNNIQGYNRLMLDNVFYNAFLDYKFILIYQLDAFVFKDELNYWCNQGFDYIGAPWIRAVDYSFFKSIKRKVQYYFHTRYNIQINGEPSYKQFEYKVGNGGFSLRRTQKFHDLCIKFRDKIDYYNSRETHLFNEDVFWSIEVNRKRKNLKIPGYKKALKFSVEFHPERAFLINKNELPFGCHAWDLNIEFWKPILKRFGYTFNN